MEITWTNVKPKNPKNKAAIMHQHLLKNIWIIPFDLFYNIPFILSAFLSYGSVYVKNFKFSAKIIQY